MDPEQYAKLVFDTKAEVERQRLLAQREVEKQRELNRVDLEKQTSLKDLELKRKKEFDQVQIAVLPLGTDSGVLGNIIQHSLTGGSKK